MNIIEKLGITPIDRSTVMYSDYISVPKKDLDDLEQQKNTLLKALIKDARFVEKSTSQGRAYKDRNSLGKDRLFMVPIIERLTNLPWQKIKDLFDA